MNDLLIAQKGEYTQNPVLGIGVSRFLRAPEDAKVRAKLEREIKLQLEADGATNVKVKVNSIDDIDIDAKYED